MHFCQLAFQSPNPASCFFVHIRKGRCNGRQFRKGKQPLSPLHLDSTACTLSTVQSSVHSLMALLYPGHLIIHFSLTKPSLLFM